MQCPICGHRLPPLTRPIEELVQEMAQELVEAEPVELHEQVKELADNLEAEA